MQETYYDKSRAVVADFKKSLRSGMREQFTSGDEDILAQMIAAAIATEVNEAVEKIEGIAKELRNKVEKPELAL